MKTRNVIRVGRPRFHHFTADESDVEIASSLAFGIESGAVFVTLVGNDTAPQDDSGPLGKALLELAIESDVESLVAVEGEGHDARTYFVLGHLMRVFRCSLFCHLISNSDT